MSFIKRILVPTDFSAPAKNALRYAQMLAGLSNAEIRVIHIFSVPVVDPYMPGDTMELLMKEVKESSEKQMKEFLSDTTGISSECFHGFVIDDAIQHAEEWHADMIVMGTTGASGAKEVFFGSNASGVLGRSSIKVMTVPESYQNFTAPTKMCYASDFTGSEELAFKVFVELAKLWNCALDVLHVESDDPVFLASKAETLFNKLAENEKYDRLSFKEVNSNLVTETIEDHVKESGVDILCMATHRRNLLERLFNKSKTKTIAHHTNIPLLSIRKN